MKVHFFSGHYLVYISDLQYVQVSYPDKQRLHIIQKMRVKTGMRAIIIAGWGVDP